MRTNANIMIYTLQLMQQTGTVYVKQANVMVVGDEISMAYKSKINARFYPHMLVFDA